MEVQLRQRLEEVERWLRRRLVHTSHDLLQPAVDSIGAAIEEGTHVDPFRRDPAFLAALAPVLRLVRGYMGAQVRGWEQLPTDEPILIVGNHSGGMTTLDPVPLLGEWLEHRGCDAPLYSLTYDLLFAYPLLGTLLRKAGCLPASHENARGALEKGASVIVFPGGDYEAFRPWSQRNEIDFGGRMGFVELALATGVRVVPMTIHGAHETTFTLTRGREIARRLGLDQLRVKVFPLLWNIPFGPMPAFIPSLPIPSKVTVQLGRPIDWSEHGREAASDPEILQACYEEVTGVMQRTLDALSEETPYPILSRLNDLRPSRVVARAWRRLRD